MPAAGWRRPRVWLKVGQEVVHVEWGKGTALSQWGKIYACPKCWEPMFDPESRTPCCNRNVETADIQDVFEIQFSDKVRPVNQDYLKPYEPSRSTGTASASNP